jgi:hypothetical protein
MPPTKEGVMKKNMTWRTSKGTTRLRLNVVRTGLRAGRRAAKRWTR